MSELFSNEELNDLASSIGGWLDDLVVAAGGGASVERTTVDKRPDGDPLWLLRLDGEAKETITIWCVLRQRTLSCDIHVVPEPTAEPFELWEFLLRRNAALVGAHYAVASARAIHLRSSISDLALTADELDRVVGTMYDAVEHDFAQILRLGFGVGLA